MRRGDHPEENCQLDKKRQDAAGIFKPRWVLDAEIRFGLPA
jgi:hypothetical protein